MLRAVNVLGDLNEPGGAVVRESRILFRHALNDVGFGVPLVHQLTRALADSDGVGSVLPEYHSITEELDSHLAQELQHAKILAQQIDFLGGTPTVKVPDVPDASDGPSALKADVELEQRQLGRYRKRVIEANDLGLPDVAEALRPLLQQTQDHVRELQDALEG